MFATSLAGNLMGSLVGRLANAYFLHLLIGFRSGIKEVVIHLSSRVINPSKVPCFSRLLPLFFLQNSQNG